VRRLAAAPDKFRGTATAAEATLAIATAAQRCGWQVDARPLSDGGEGFVEVLGGAARSATVRGPLGAPVVAMWSLHDDGTAIVESAQAVGRALLQSPHGDDPLRASTYGVGELLAAAVAAGAHRLVVGCGGTSSTDGGNGCLDALDDLGITIEIPIVVACDVDVGFLDAPSQFGPQKGANRAQVRELEVRLNELADRFLARFGVDVRSVAGAGAGGGLAGGLVALGAQVVGGAHFVAEFVGLRSVLTTAEVVVTGEGRLDAATLRGKVVREVLATAPEPDALVVAGRADWHVVDALRMSRRGRVDVAVLDPRLQSLEGTTAAISKAVASYLTSRG
jgi:glycerate 2-kinase